MKMEDPNKQPTSFGSGAPRSPHPRPFFYVQPPSQPYYLYPPWQLTNPYSHFGLPAGFNLSRPSLPPYPYMPYPGFVLPHAPIYPMDYRRMFEPRFQAPTWGDVPRQQYHPQAQGRRETACSGAQTDPSDAINKLIECLDKIRTTELQSAGRELDSGVASQSSGVFSPVEERKTEKQGHSLSSDPHHGLLESPGVTLSDCNAVVYESESSQVILDPLSPQGGWTGRLGEELPLDSSSVHEECPYQLATGEHLVPHETEKVTDIQSNISVTDSSVRICDPEKDQKSVPSLPSSQLVLTEIKNCDQVLQTEDAMSSCDQAKADESSQILKLPFDGVLAPGAAHLSSLAAPYYYSYLPMQTTHERMSVLSPSLDELSSRDEMFSTDLDDGDLFPVYPSRRLSAVVGGSPRAADEEEDAWLPKSKRVVCACCGKNLEKGMGRRKVHGSKVCCDEAGDSEDEVAYSRGCKQPIRVVVRKHSAPRKTQTVQRHPAKLWCQKSQYKELPDHMNPEESHEVCQQEAAETETEELESRELQCRTCQDGLCRADLTTVGPGRWPDGDVVPRRRRAAPLQRQEMSTQWKLMYHRPRDDHEGDVVAQPLNRERDMEAVASNLQHSFGLGPRGPGLNPKLGSEQAAPGPPRPEEQHHKPFFYVQPSQQYLPMQGMQWPVAMPMPMSYNPYYGYPGLGFGLPMMPHYQSNPYMEPPGFVIPHTHLHLMDYRRMLNPQYYHTMAYHARRFRYQHNPTSKEMTTSEAQTEPLNSVQRTSTPRSSDCTNNDALSVVTGQLQSPALGVKTEDQEKAPSSTMGMSSNSSFVIQTEEVRIECCTTPVGLQLLHAHEAVEMSHGISQDPVQSSSPTQCGILPDEGVNLPADQSEQELNVCPDILLVGKTNPGEKTLSREEPRNHMDPVTANEVEESSTDDDLSMTSKSFHYKVVHVPFDPTYLDELRKMESTVWSAEETFMTSPVQNSFTKGSNKTLNASPEVNALEMVMLTKDIPTDEVISVTQIPPLAEVEVEEMIPTLEMSEANICPPTDTSPLPELTDSAEATLSANVILLDNSLQSDREQNQLDTTNDQDSQDTSFESLPAYLPSTSWLSDFDHSYYCRKMPLGPVKPNRSSNLHELDVSKARRKLDMNYKEQPNVRKPKDRYKPKGKVDRQSFSDHECCLSRNFGQDVVRPHGSKSERLCTRCTAKRRISTSPSSVCEGRSLKRKAVPLQQWNDVPLPTCEACKSHTKRVLMRKGSNPDLCSSRYAHDTEGESSGNGSCRAGPKRRAADNSRKLQDIKRPLLPRQMETRSPVEVHTMLRESNCLHNDLQNQPVGCERFRRCPHGNAIREIDENCELPVSLENWRNLDQMYLTHRRQTADRSWRDATLNTCNGRFLKEATSQHLIHHKKTQPPSQGICTKETRC